MTRGIKSNKIEAQKKVTEIVGYLCLGMSRAQIIQKCAEWETTVVDRQIDTYIQQANKCLENESAFNRRVHIGKAIRRLEYIYLKSLSVQDFQRALAAQKELNLLLGLNAPTRQITLSKDVTKLSDNELEQELAKYESS